MQGLRDGFHGFSLAQRDGSKAEDHLPPVQERQRRKKFTAFFAKTGRKS
jgi:hypothetical protein